MKALDDVVCYLRSRATLENNVEVQSTPAVSIVRLNSGRKFSPFTFFVARGRRPPDSDASNANAFQYLSIQHLGSMCS